MPDDNVIAYRQRFVESGEGLQHWVPLDEVMLTEMERREMQLERLAALLRRAANDNLER